MFPETSLTRGWELIGLGRAARLPREARGPGRAAGDPQDPDRLERLRCREGH